MKKCHSAILMIVLLGVVSFAGFAGDVEVGTGMWLRFHHGPSSFALTPGLSVDASYSPVGALYVGAKAVSGAFFGYSTGIELSAGFAPEIGPWAPRVGLGVTGIANSTVLYYHGGASYVPAPTFEWGAGVVLKAFRFDFESFGISAFEVSAGYDLQNFGDILLVDVDLFRVFVTIGGKK